MVVERICKTCKHWDGVHTCLLRRGNPNLYAERCHCSKYVQSDQYNESQA